MPREVFPIASVAANTFQQCCTTFPVLLVLGIAVTHSPVRVALAAVVLAAIVAMTAGFSLALAALYVFFRDLPHVWAIIGFVLWLTSPVFYPAALVPDAVRAYIGINPVGMAMSTLRDLIVVRGPIPWSAVGVTLVTSLAIVVVGAAVFRALRDDFMDLL
jgi:ABC-type polysaccharide/polyol phosphate export permease